MASNQTELQKEGAVQSCLRVQSDIEQPDINHHTEYMYLVQDMGVRHKTEPAASIYKRSRKKGAGKFLGEIYLPLRTQLKGDRTLLLVRSNIQEEQRI